MRLHILLAKRYFHKGYFRGHQFFPPSWKIEFFCFLDYLFISLSFSSHWFCKKKIRIPSFHWFHTRLVHQLFWLHLKKRKIQSEVKFPKPNNSIKPFIKWKKLHKFSVQVVCPMKYRSLPLCITYLTLVHLANQINS